MPCMYAPCSADIESNVGATHEEEQIFRAVAHARPLTGTQKRRKWIRVAHTLPCMYAPCSADIESNVGATHATQPVDFQRRVALECRPPAGPRSRCRCKPYVTLDRGRGWVRQPMATPWATLYRPCRGSRSSAGPISARTCRRPARRRHVGATRSPGCRSLTIELAAH